MTKKVCIRFFISLAALSSLALASWAGSSSAIAQNNVTGEWRASLEEGDSTKIHLNFERRTEKGHKNQSGQSYDFAELRGLSREQAVSGGPVNLALCGKPAPSTAKAVFKTAKALARFDLLGTKALFPK